MGRLLRTLAAVATVAMLGGGGVLATATAAPAAVRHADRQEVVAKKKKHKNKRKKHTMTTATTPQTLTSDLSLSACLIETQDESTLSTNATTISGGDTFEQPQVGAVEFPNPIPVSIKEDGKRVSCTFESGSDFTIKFDVVDFPGSGGNDAAKRAYETVKDAYQPGNISGARPSGPPEGLTGLGDEAFVATRDDGNAKAFVAVQGEILVRADGTQVPNTGAATIDFDALQAVTAKVLAKAVGEVASAGTSSDSSTNPKGNTGTGEITTTGAVKGTWKIRIADLGISSGCSEIPLISDDGTTTGWVNAGTGGQVTFHTQRLTSDLHGDTGGTVQLPTDIDVPHPEFKVDIDSTVKEMFTGKNVTHIKGSFDYMCAVS